jgi:hypothetical protein
MWQTHHHWLGSAAYCKGMGNTHETPWVHPLCSAGWRLGQCSYRANGFAYTAVICCVIKNTNKMETQKFEIVSTQSNIDWVGKKVTGAHNGTIAIKEGELI